MPCYGRQPHFHRKSFCQMSRRLPAPRSSSNSDLHPRASSVSGVQFDIQYDNSALSLTATLGDSAKSSGKNLYAVDLAANEKRFLIIGLNQTLIADGNLMNLYIKISPNAPKGAYSLAQSNVCGTDPSGQPLAVTGTNGTLTVTAGSVGQPQLTGIENSGSFLPGPLAPGELVTLVGTGIGPSSAQIPSGSATNTVLGGTSVLFDPNPHLFSLPRLTRSMPSCLSEFLERQRHK